MSGARMLINSLFQPPPFTLPVPVKDVLHGTEVVDPYRWLEDQNAPQTRRWVAEQNEYSRSYFASLPDRPTIRRRISQLLSNEFVSAPWEVSGRTFFERRTAKDEQPLIVMRQRSGEESVLIDPSSQFPGASASATITAVSSDGRFLAFALRFGGTDTAQIRIVDVKSRSLLEDRLPDGYCTGFAFTSSVPGFYYSHQTLSSQPSAARVMFHRLGDPSSNDLEIFESPLPHGLIQIVHQPTLQLLLYVVTCTGARRTTTIYLQREFGGSADLLVPEQEARIAPFFSGKELLAYTDLDAPNRRIVSFDLTNGNPGSWRDIVPHTAQRIRQFSVASGRIFVARTHRFSISIDVYHTDGTPDGSLPVPPYSTVDFLNPVQNSDKLFFGCTSLNTAPVVYECDPASKRTSLWQTPQTQDHLELISTEEAEFQSKDGTIIPLLLAFKKDLSLRSCRSAFLTGYGGFGNVVTPRFNAFSTFLLEQGFLIAVPAIRGGGELGAEWHEAGKLGKRQNAFDDFIACAEWLIENGLTAAGNLAIGGGSNAGLLVGAAITQRPDLFRAAVCLGPLLDMLRYHRFDRAANWLTEYGSPEEEADFRWLSAYSPYHRVLPDHKYPAVLLISGDADERCNPMHARKMTARLQAASSSGHPVLLDYKTSWGHVPVQPLHTKIESLADRLSFVCHELGVRVPDNGGAPC